MLRTPLLKLEIETQIVRRIERTIDSGVLTLISLALTTGMGDFLIYVALDVMGTKRNV